MNIQEVSANYNYGSMNFKGMIHKSAIKQYQRDVQISLNKLSREANEKGMSVNELITKYQDITSEGHLVYVEESTLKLLQDKCKLIMDAVIDYMTKAHKDSKFIYHRPHWDFAEIEPVYGKFTYKNSKLGQEVVVCDDKSNYTPQDWQNDFYSDRKSNLTTSLLMQDYDKKLETKALEKLEEKAKNTNTKLGLWLLKREGKKIEEFEQETGMEVTDTSRLIEETMYKTKWQEKLEKQNREIVEKQKKAVLEMQKNFKK